MSYRSAFLKPLIAAGATLVGAGGVLTVFAFRAAPTIKPHVKVHGVEVGGLSAQDAAKKLRIWWESERREPLALDWASGPKSAALPAMTATQLGVTIDDVATIAALPTQGAGDSIKAFFHSDPGDPSDYPIKLKPVLVDLSPLQKQISLAAGPFRPAKVGFSDGQIILKAEVPSFALDVKKLPDAIEQAFNEKNFDAHTTKIELPIEQAPKHVPDEALRKITDLVSSYTTHFPSYQSSRINNIRVAAGKLSGVVLLPGERLSFNGTVGERTINSGFKEAGIYLNGKHDKGIGGGICQVSSTLYNAALFGNLKIVRHHNHSMPVAYVPIGRDATVNYGVIDLVLENPYETPIAVTSEFHPGSLTFRIFGVADPTLSISIERKGLEDWDQPVKYTFDPHLKPGQEVVVEKGSRGHRVYVYRHVMKSGVLVKREALGESYYTPSPKIIARGPAPVGGFPSPAVAPPAYKP